MFYREVDTADLNVGDFCEFWGSTGIYLGLVQPVSGSVRISQASDYSSTDYIVNISFKVKDPTRAPPIEKLQLEVPSVPKEEFETIDKFEAFIEGWDDAAMRSTLHFKEKLPFTVLEEHLIFLALFVDEKFTVLPRIEYGKFEDGREFLYEDGLRILSKADLSSHM